MTVYHIIDHTGFGTIHRLLLPLCDAYACHKVLVRKSPEEFIDRAQLAEIVSNQDARIIIHSTGNMDHVCLNELASLHLPAGRRFLFLHTSYAYQKAKGRGGMVYALRELQDKYHILVLTPSKEVATQYRQMGIHAVPVQLGVPGIMGKPKSAAFRDELSRYYNRYITTCSSEKEIYRHVKGIDRFIALSRKYGLERECLIAGVALPNQTIESVRFNEDDFLNILYHAKAYIQLSRFESYNLTAAWAKQFRVPALVLGAEGTWSSMGRWALGSEAEAEEKLRQVMAGNYSAERLDECLRDSCRRESLENFHRSLTEVLTLTDE